MASSSKDHLKPPPDDKSIKIIKPAPLRLEGKLAPSRGRVYIDRDHLNNFFITDVINSESAKLPRGVWELVFADDGVGVALLNSADKDNPVTAEKKEFLEFEVFIVPSGEVRVISTSKKGVWYSVVTEQAKHAEIELEVQVGASAATCLIQLFEFGRARHNGAKLYVSTQSTTF